MLVKNKYQVLSLRTEKILSVVGAPDAQTVLRWLKEHLEDRKFLVTVLDDHRVRVWRDGKTEDLHVVEEV